MANTMNRRNFLATAGATVAAVSAATSANAQDVSDRKRNVLIYVVDDQGSTDAGCYGNPVIKTPGLDRLAESGVRFTHGFCTTASCSASRSVILSGLHNHANGQYGHQHSYHHFSSFDDVESLPVRLSKAGYRTGQMGKYHVAPETVYHFDTYLKAKGNVPTVMADACREFIAEESDDPFFLYFCTTQPHRPFHRPDADPVSPDDVIVRNWPSITAPSRPPTPDCCASSKSCRKPATGTIPSSSTFRITASRSRARRQTSTNPA